MSNKKRGLGKGLSALISDKPSMESILSSQLKPMIMVVRRYS